MDKKSFWIGLGVGVVAGGIGGFVAGNQITKKHAQRDIADRCKQAYIRGKREAEADCIVVDAPTPECIQKAIDAHFATSDGGTKEESSDSAEAAEGPLEGQIEASERQKTAKSEEKAISEVKAASSDVISATTYRIHGDYIIFMGAAGTELYYPKSLLYDGNNVLYDEMQARQHILEYESDVAKLRMIWNALGWGLYIPARDGLPRMEDVDDWETPIGLESEPEEATEARRKYVELLEKYKNDPNAARPTFISEDEFKEEAYLDQEYYDYYPVDNVFVKNDDINTPVDGFNLFGTDNGQELFERKADLLADSDHGMSTLNGDPDIVHMRNFKMNIVAEITRYPGKSYAGLRDGSAYVS